MVVPLGSVSQVYPALRICRQAETGRDPSTPAACRVKALKNRADLLSDAVDRIFVLQTA